MAMTEMNYPNGGSVTPEFVTDIWYNGSSAQTYTFTSNYSAVLVTNHSTTNMTYIGSGTKTTIYRGDVDTNHFAEIIYITDVKVGDTITFPIVSSSLTRVIAEIVSL